MAQKTRKTAMVATNRPPSFIYSIIYLSMAIATILVQPVFSVTVFEFTNAEAAGGFFEDKAGSEAENFEVRTAADSENFGVRGGNDSKKRCRTISEYYSSVENKKEWWPIRPASHRLFAFFGLNSFDAFLQLFPQMIFFATTTAFLFCARHWNRPVST
jgi:hypothetical protein